MSLYSSSSSSSSSAPYTLVWRGRLWIVSVPPELTRDQWMYVQAFVTSNGNHTAAMMRLFEYQYPGLGFTQGVRDVVSLYGAPAVSFGSDTSSLSCSKRTDFRKSIPPSLARGATGAVSDTSGRRTPTLQSATSTASRPTASASAFASAKAKAPGPPVQRLPPTQNARPHTVGWMGSSATSVG